MYEGTSQSIVRGILPASLFAPSMTSCERTGGRTSFSSQSNTSIVIHPVDRQRVRERGGGQGRQQAGGAEEIYRAGGRAVPEAAGRRGGHVEGVNTERAVLTRVRHPFIIKLRYGAPTDIEALSVCGRIDISMVDVGQACSVCDRLGAPGPTCGNGTQRSRGKREREERRPQASIRGASPSGRCCVPRHRGTNQPQVLHTSTGTFTDKTCLMQPSTPPRSCTW